MKKFGYLGLVRSSDFINGEQLAKEIGLKEGEPHHLDCDWLHFILEGQEILIPTKTFRHSISWRAIYERGAVYSDTEGFGLYPFPTNKPRNQNTFVDIAGGRYKVTLLKGSNGDNQTHTLGYNYNNHPSLYDSKSTWDSEWNQLMYRVHDGVHNSDYSNPVNASHPYGVWDQLSDTQLQLDCSKDKNGTASWCQEKGTWEDCWRDRRVVRGFCGVSFVHCNVVDSSHPLHGWRPALRKI